MVNHFRGFSTAEGHTPPGRTIDNDAPQPLRQEFVDLVLHIAEHDDHLDPLTLYRTATQSLGTVPAGDPYGGPRRALGRDIAQVAWPRVYDLMVRLWPNFYETGRSDEYLDGVRQLLPGHGIAWDMDDDGQLHRVLHPAAQAAVDATVATLTDQRFADARRIFDDARAAYDDRPRRDRDACANVFDAMESAAKITRAMPTATFHNVLQRIRGEGNLNGQIVGVLDSVNTLRNRNFGHGTEFALRPEDVDFTYTVCTAGIVLLAR